MNEQFVTYEIVLKLEELGFDEPVLGYFDRQSKELFIGLHEHASNIPSVFLKAPLWQQVINWFISKHGIQIGEYPVKKYKEARTFFIFNMLDKSTEPIAVTVGLEKAILKAIELCKKN